METKINTTKPELNKLTFFRQAIYEFEFRLNDSQFSDTEERG
jgi:hypothetical protein